MKKKLFVLILLLLFMPFVVSAQDFYNIEEKNLEEALLEENIGFKDLKYNKENGIKIYLFRGKGCTYCHKFLEFASSDLIEKYGDKVNFVTYEVWYNSYNQELYDAVKNYFGIKRDGVPLIVIGDNYIPGYSSAYNDQIYRYIEVEDDALDKTDVIKGLVEGTLKPKVKTDDEDDMFTPEDDIILEDDEKDTFFDKVKEFFDNNKDTISLIAICLISTLFPLILVIILIFVYKKIKKSEEVIKEEKDKEKNKEKVKQ